VDGTAPKVTQALVAKQKLAAILRLGVKIRFHCSEACTVRDTLTLSAGQARRLHVGRKIVRLGAGSKRIANTGTLVVSVKLTATGKRLVRRFRTLPLTSTATVTDAHRNTRRSVKVFTLRR
jgi:hypothetical protein